MIVDDHAGMREVLKSFLHHTMSATVEILECTNGEAAVEAYPSFRPDCVLMDFQLGKLNGLEASRRICEMDSEANVIIVTSYDTLSLRKRAGILPLKGFINKENLSDVYPILQSITKSHKQ